MADFLIQHLKKKADEHSSLALLVNQWGFDEKLVPKALQSVGNLFPHYSRHDESHSKQILVNIERLLGDNIDKLTATDTWLLLEAAYWHDIGMVVPQKDITDAFADPVFKSYLEQIRNTPHHELQQFALHFKSSGLSGWFGGADTPMLALDKFRQLMAEWFRRQHAARAKQTIEAPWESAGISSPRTELIPARLFKLLGRVCQMHGLPFKDLLKALPFREAGLAQEDCHPRFVAGLLRMGDLLDLDDNRFCPVMQRIAGEQRPALSRAHEDKHASIRHLRMDCERIEISAECATIDGYLETYKWFEWLKQEMQDQMSHWQDIVPNRVFGLLPTLGELEISMCGEHEILNDGQRPQFSVDGPRAIKLLQGNNLYSNKFACIRELLQNAVDASLLRLWLTEGGKHPADIWQSPFTDGAKKVMADAKIVVELTGLPPDATTPDDESRWRLRINDSGTGISRDDLIHMLRIGGAQDNAARQEKINTMPEWMKPSGAFGIGFQSVFLICDEVILKTKSIFTNETFEITLHDPAGKNQGLALLKPLQNDISLGYGTSVEVIFSLSRNRWTCPSRSDTHAAKATDNYDPIFSSDIVMSALNMADEIESFSKGSPLKICGKFQHANGQEIKISDLGECVRSETQMTFGDANGHSLGLRYAPCYGDHGQLHTQYRGQKFKNEIPGFPGVDIWVNLMFGKADDWLKASRDEIASDAAEPLRKTVLEMLRHVVEKDLSNQTGDRFPTQEDKEKYSLFLEMMSMKFGAPWTVDWFCEAIA